MTNELFPCLCCGYYTLPKVPGGTYETCQVCSWCDLEINGGYDFYSYRDYWETPEWLSLADAQANLYKYGAINCSEKKIPRTAEVDFKRIAGYSSLDGLRDKFLFQTISAVEMSFGDVGFPSGGTRLYEALLAENRGHETEKIGRYKEMHYLRWQDIPPETIPEVCESIFFFDPPSFRFFLPAFLMYALRYWRVDELDILSSIETCVTSSGTSFGKARLAAMKEAERSALERFFCYFAIFGGAFSAERAKKTSVQIIQENYEAPAILWESVDYEELLSYVFVDRFLRTADAEE